MFNIRIGVWGCEPNGKSKSNFETRSGGLGWIKLRILSIPPPRRGRWDIWMEGGWKDFSFGFRAFRGVSAGVPLFSGGFRGFGWGLSFRVSVGEVLFEDVGILGFWDSGISGVSGMLDFQMFGCWWIVTSNAFVLGWMILGNLQNSKMFSACGGPWLTFWNTCRNYSNPL